MGVPRPLPVLRYGDWEIKVLDEDTVRLSLSGEEPIDIVWHSDHDIEVRELVFCLDTLNRTMYEGGFSWCVEDTYYELTRTDGEWSFRAEGAFSFRLDGLTTQQALSLALLMTYIKESSPLGSELCESIRMMGILPVFRRAGEVKLRSKHFEAVMTWSGNKARITPLRADSKSDFLTVISLADAGLMEREVELEPEEGEEEIVAMLLSGEALEDEKDWKPFIRMRRELARLLITQLPHDSEAEVMEDKVIVRNSYGTWEIDLDDGYLRLNDEHICVEPKALMPGLILLPGLGEIAIGKPSMEVMTSIMVALRPEDVRDPELKKEILKASLEAGSATAESFAERLEELARALRERSEGI